MNVRKRPLASRCIRTFIEFDVTLAAGASNPWARNASLNCTRTRLFGGASIHGSFTSSAGAIARRRAHRLSLLATTRSLSSKRVSISIASSAQAVDTLPSMRSTLRSRSSRNSRAAIFASVTWNVTCGCRLENTSIIAGTNPAASDSGHPMRTSPVAGSAKYSMSRRPSWSSSNTTVLRLSRACA